MRKSTLLSFLLFTNLIAQVNPTMHTMNWHFGSNCSIDFNSGPVAGGSSMNTSEGTSVMSDPANGTLLFYTNGVTVYDKFGTMMPNGTGLFGHNSSAQSAIIAPGNVSGVPFYYVFTCDQSGYMGINKGVYYSIVDMTINSGLGDVTSKNVPVLPGNCEERMAVVRACNGEDFWLITHKFMTDSFFVFPVTAGGIGAPVISKVGSVHNNVSNQFYEGVGCMAVSPDGDRLALSVYHFENFIELFHFNQLTGQITNPIKLKNSDLGVTQFQPYGVCFSSDNKKLYFTHSNENWIGPVTQIFQVDVSTWNQSAIAASSYVVNALANRWYYAINRGPDNKIYVAKTNPNQSFLDVINNPDIAGTNCNFQLNGFSIPGGTVNIGLPYFYTELIAGDESCNGITYIEKETDEGFSLYPNPSSGTFNLKWRECGEVTITVYNPGGEILYRKNIYDVSATDINLRGKASGIVYIKFTSEKYTTVRKCLIR